MCYEKWTTKYAVDRFCKGEEDTYEALLPGSLLPDDLRPILQKHGVAMLAGRNGGEWCSVADAPGTELEAAMEALLHDLASCHFLPYDEAHEWADSYAGHQQIEAREAVLKILN